MKSFSSIFLSFLALLILLGSFPAIGQAVERVESAQRLRFLRNATGQPSSSSSFRAKVDSMLNVSADAPRSVIASQDTKNREAREMRLGQVDTLVSTGVSNQDFSERIAKNTGDDKEEVQKSAKEERLIDNFKIDGTERNFAFERADFSRKIDQQKEDDKVLRQMMEERAREESEGAAAEKETSPMGLSENRFYFGPMSVPERDEFIENAGIYRNRLETEGYDHAEIDEIMSRISSGEELVIYMMTEEGYNYREARSIVER